MKATILLLVFALLTLQISAQSNKSTKKEVLSSFCQLTVSDSFFQLNISFTEAYSFKVNDEGKPVDIKKLYAKYVKVDEVSDCLSSWKFSGFPKDTRFQVYFTWKHAIGWTQMKIRTKNFTQTTIYGDN